MKTIIATVATVGLALLLSAGAPADKSTQGTGSITGRVVSALDSTALAYANVIVVGTRYGAMTMPDGHFRIDDVPAGRYTIRVMMMGYKASEKTGVVVGRGRTQNLAFMMEETIVAKTQEIAVTAEKPLIEVSESAVRGMVSSDQLERMPVDDVLESVALKAGIAKSGDEMHVRGGSASRERDKRNVPGRVPQSIRMQSEPGNTENYSAIVENTFHDAREHPVSTFSVDVDAASYANTRRFLSHGQLPPADAVRIEEMINYFNYDYPDPVGKDPFSIITEVADCPWNRDHRLLHVGLQGRRVAVGDLPPGNLVFLIDVSGSMRSADKLPLLKSGFRMLVDNLRPQDRVAIVVYAGAAGLVLPPTKGDRKDEILCAIDRLEAGGSTAGAAGIRLAYEVAERNFIRRGNNRVILATDGDFNVGLSSDSELVRMIEEKRQSGVFLTVLGFGTGNLKDSRMEQLADKGNGNYSYIDDVFEARRVLVNELGATLFTIAKDVKIQLEFNPAKVKSYRLIGYENRMLRREDFDDDRKDAGEIGAGHSVTALYEIEPVGQRELSRDDRRDEYKYVSVGVRPEAEASDEMLTIRFRYKKPDRDDSILITDVVLDRHQKFTAASDDFRFSAAVAEFAMLLRGSEFRGDAAYDHVMQAAASSIGRDDGGYRREFVRLVAEARRLCGNSDDRDD